MSGFNSIELILGRFLERFPALRKEAKRVYQRLCMFIYRKNYSFLTNYPLRCYSFGNKETFFGYYDKSPVSADGSKILFHASDLLTRKPPDPEFPVDIVCMELSTGKTLYHASSSAYNWQQGARLFWVGDDTFVFNNYQDDTKSFNACIVDLKKPDGTFMLDRPVYDCRNGMFISLDFSRLAAAGSEYGYYNGSPEKYDLYDLQNDGVFLGSLSTGKSEQILSLERIANCGTGKWHSETIHTVNHLMFNPSGSAFVFIHRYYSKGKKSDRLMHYKISDDLLTVLSDHNMVSHYGWKNDAEMICYMRRFDAGDRYYHIDCESKVIKVFSRTDVFSGRDGHPSFCVNRLVFDTYPDKARIKDLYIYDAEKEMITVAGSFYESLDYYDATRCDLHPRWGSSCGEVFFDSVHEGRRRLYSMKVNQLKHP